MNRRAVIRDLLLIAGGATMLPSCLNKSGKASLALRNIEISSEQENLLAEIAETIIPKTGTPGAKEVGSHLFVLKMLDDCYDKEDQQEFIKGMNELDKSAKSRFHNPFVDCNRAQKEQILLAVENKESFPPEVFRFYNIMKEKTLQGYMTSKYVLLNITKYEMIPSMAYNGYYLIKNIKSDGRHS
jgi:gluconate 2-dehydrogenase subunit 3-like protein